MALTHTQVLKVKNTFIDFDDEVANLNDDDWTIGKKDFSRFVTEPMPITRKLSEAASPAVWQASTADTLPRVEKEGDGDSDSLTGTDSDSIGSTSQKGVDSDSMGSKSTHSNSKRAVTAWADLEVEVSEPKKEMQSPVVMGYNEDMAAPVNQFPPWCLPTGANGAAAMTQCYWPMPFPMAYPQAVPWMPTTMATPSVNCAQSPSSSWRNVHTVMMRNLPNRVTQQQLLSEMNEAGFENQYDFVYLPIDPDTKANRGYAFINFTTPPTALAFRMHFEGQKFCNLHSRKVVSVMPATLQGFEANYAHYSSAHVNFRDAGSRPLFLREPKFNKFQRRGGQKSLIDEAAKQTRIEHEVQPKIQQQKVLEATAIMVAAPVAKAADAGADEPSDPSHPRVAKFCTSCGGSIQGHYKFCKFCGCAM